MHAFINSSAPWLNEHIKSFIRQHVRDVVFIDDFAEFPVGADVVFQYCDGWELNENFAALNAAKNGLLNAYPSSDAVARKDYLAAVVEYWAAKRPGTSLKKHVPLTVRLTLDYSEYVDEALMAADDLSLLCSLEKNESRDLQDREWWILKPALVDCGAGIRLFSTVEELAGHLELVENETDDDEESEGSEVGEESEAGEEGEESEAGSTETEPPRDSDKDADTTTKKNTPVPTLSTPGLDTLDGLVTVVGTLALNKSTKARAQRPLRPKKPQYIFKAGGRIPSAQMRAFVAQRYIAQIPPVSGRKWHVRAYALALGRLKVHVSRDLLALLAAEPYRPPWENPSLRASLTNTALQDAAEVAANESMRDFWTLGGEDDGGLFPDRPDWTTHVFYQICGVVAEVFRAAAWTMADKFVTVDKCFEVFAVDFLVDAGGNAWLLEVNETPAFYEHGVAGAIALRLMESVVCATMEHMGMATVGDPKNAAARNRLVEVLDETAKLGKSNIVEILPV